MMNDRPIVSGNRDVMGAREGELYHPNDDEWAAIEEGFAQAKRREAVSADEIAALFKQRGS